MDCPHCAKGVEIWARTCPYCGEGIHEDTTEPPQYETTTATVIEREWAREREEVNARWFWLAKTWIIFLIVIALIILVKG
jgi:hypothetical protein